jgi:hypothetical protein
VPSLNLIPLVSTESATVASGVTPTPTLPSELITNDVASGVSESSILNASPVPRCVILSAGTALEIEVEIVWFVVKLFERFVAAALIVDEAVLHLNN